MPQSPENFLVFGEDGSVTVREGLATIEVRSAQPNGTLPTDEEKKAFAETTFYNPIQEFNRDMSILAISSWAMMGSEKQRIKLEKLRLKEENRQKWMTGTKRPSDNTSKSEKVSESESKDVDGNKNAKSNTKSKSTSLEKESPDRKKQCVVSRRDYQLARHDKKIVTQTKPSPLQELPTTVVNYVTEWEAKTEYLASNEGKEQLENSFKSWIEKTPKISILEALAASGLRSVRYARELRSVGKILCNDLDLGAAKAISRNSELNGVADIVKANQGDASLAIITNPGYDVIDLDPYGSAAPFLDAAVKSVADGGLLCVTCTDLAVLAGSQSESCFAKYGCMAVANTPYCHEMALRILLQHIAQSAAKYKRAITPLLSLSIDFYVRVFVKVEESASGVKDLVGHSGMFYHCTYCKTVFTQPLGKSPENGDGNKRGPVVSQFKIPSECGNCKGSYHIGGPIWLRPIHSPEFLSTMQMLLEKSLDTDVESMNASRPERTSNPNVTVENALFKFGTYKRMKGMLELASQELPTHFYYSLPELSSVVHAMQPPLTNFVSALFNNGVKVSQTHCKPNCFKTTATPEIVWDTLRDWVAIHPVKRVSARSVANILKISFDDTKEATTVNSEITEDELKALTAKFEKHPKSKMFSKASGIVRFQSNPTKFWGPKSKAKKA